MSAHTQNSTGGQYHVLSDTTELKNSALPQEDNSRINAAYSGHIRRELNDLGNTAFVRSANAVELKGGVISNAADLLSTVVGAAPIIGDTLSAGFKLAGMTAKKVEENQGRECAKRIAEISSCDQKQWNVFTKTLSRELAEERSSNSAEDARKLAAKDLEQIKTAFIERKLPEFSDKKGLSDEEAVKETVNAVKTVILNPKDKTIPLRKENPQTDKAFKQAKEVAKDLHLDSTQPDASHANESWIKRTGHNTSPNQNSR